MPVSKVYFTDFKLPSGKNLLDKLENLARKAGFFSIDYKNKFTAIKIHFGEPGNLAYIRPNYAAKIVNMIKTAGGLPFLTDCNTLYKGRRANAVDHLQSAAENGFNSLSAGCNVIIADGLKGTDYREITVNRQYCKTAKIGTAIADADIIISMTHFKGHELTGFGGCLKNLGMGCGSIGGKLEMHSDSQPKIFRKNCTGCRQCVVNCAHDAVHLDEEKKAVIDYEKCVGCGQCIAICRYDAARAQWNAGHAFEKIDEYAMAALQDKQHFHISFLTQISPDCDCWGYNDIPIAPDIGILASGDPVALDKASVDMVNNTDTVKNSVIGNKPGKGYDKFSAVFPNTNWKKGLDYAEKIGLGSQDYDLIAV